MYLLIVIAFMGVLPIASILVELQAAGGSADLVALFGKWFVFWAGGVRLLTAGLSQIVRPAFTAETIFEIKDPDAAKIVSELGFANVSIGTMSVLSLFFPDWVLPAALCGGLFYGLAGAKHVFNAHRNRNENIALVSDLLIFAILAAYVIATIARP
jgi:hypothetical protein